LENTGKMKKIPIRSMHKYDIISLFLICFKNITNRIKVQVVFKHSIILYYFGG
jgi:hypothetical protein